MDHKPVDRLPFRPKINGAYAKAHAAPFATLDMNGLHEHSADRIIQELKAHLDALPHHRGLVITSAGVAELRPPAGCPDRLRPSRLEGGAPRRRSP